MKEQILNLLEEILNKYHNSSDNCFNFLRYDEFDNEYWLKDEIILMLQKYLNEQDFCVQEIEAFCKSNLDVRVLTISMIIEGNLVVFNKKLLQF